MVEVPKRILLVITVLLVCTGTSDDLALWVSTDKNGNKNGVLS
jgi:hypothetical protein